MLPISVNKDEVNANFPGYYYPLYSLVIIREDNTNTLGRIIGYSGNNKVIVHSKSGKKYKLKYSDIVFYEDPHKPVMTLKEIEKLSHKYINKYKKESVSLDSRNYIIDVDVDFVLDTESVTYDDSPTALGAVCPRYKDNQIYAYEFRLLVPFLQYASKKQIKEVILHETAHLLAGRIERDWHGRIWRLLYMAIGGNGRATVDVEDAAYLGLYYTELPKDWTDPTHYDIPKDKWKVLLELIAKNMNSLPATCFSVGVGSELLSSAGYGTGNINKKVSDLIMSIIKHFSANDQKVDIDIVKTDINVLYKLSIELRDKLTDLLYSRDHDNEFPKYVLEQREDYSKDLMLADDLYFLLKSDFKELSGA